MNDAQKRAFVSKMGKSRRSLYKGGAIKRQNYDSGGAIRGAMGGAATGAALGSVIPGVGNVVGAIGGGLAGLLGGLFSDDSPKMPNIVDPVTGQQITDANGNVVANEQAMNAFAASIQGQNGAQVQQQVMNRLNEVAEGVGPNPALDALNQSTASNISNQAALIAGQRGASSNAGLIARQVAQQGASTQQQAIGQAATLQSEQQLNALGARANIGGQLVGEQQAAMNAAGTLAATHQGQLLGAQGQYNTNITGGQGNVNSNQTSQNNTALNAIVPIGMNAFTGAGQAAAYTGTPSFHAPGISPEASRGTGSTMRPYAQGGQVVDGPHGSHVANFLMMSEGGKVQSRVSPGEIYLSPDKVQEVLDGASPLKVGEKIPGKAKTKGDSRKNDTVDRTLDEGGVVVPRSHVMSADKAALFVHRAMAKKGRR